MKFVQKHKMLVVVSCLLIFVFVGKNIFAQTNPTLSVTCSPDSTTKTTGVGVTWTAHPTGGNGIYEYSWSGSNGLVGSTQSVTWTYNNEGVQTAQVSVASGGQSATATCTGVDIRLPQLVGYCSVIGTINPDGSYILQYDSNVLNTTATTTTFNWTGSDGISGTQPGIMKTYPTATSSPGVKQANVSIVSGPQTLNFQCSADVHPSPTFPQSNTQSFMAGCKPVISGMTVHWDAAPTASGLSTTTYSWSGTDGATATTSAFDKTYTTEGTKSATLTVNSGTQSMTLQCQARVASTTVNGAGHCFIATAVFGTPLEPEVMTLRHFRDETLYQTVTGKLVVKAYYAISPPIAEYIRDKEPVKEVVRTSLKPILYTLNKLGYEK
jgi:hypothetical protein